MLLPPAFTAFALFAGTAQAKNTPLPPAPPPPAPLAVAGVTLDASTVVAGTSLHGVVTLDRPAPIATTFAFDTTSVDATVPTSLTVAAGATSIDFTVTTTAIVVSRPIDVEAWLGSSSARATFRLVPAAPLPPAPLGAVTADSPAITGGGSMEAVVSVIGEVDTPTPIALSSSSAAAAVPTSVIVPAWEGQARFTIKTNGVTAATPVTVTADLGGVTKSTTFTVKPLPAAPPVISLSLIPVDHPAVFPGGFDPFPGLLVGIKPEPGPDVVAVTTSDPAVTVNGRTSANVPVGAIGCSTVACGSEIDLDTHCIAPLCIGTPPPVNVTVTVAFAGVTQSIVVPVGPNPNIPPIARLAGLNLFVGNDNPAAPPGQLVGGDCCSGAFAHVALTTNNYPEPSWATVTTDHPELVTITEDPNFAFNTVPDSAFFGALGCCSPPQSASVELRAKAVTVPTTVHVTAGWDGEVVTVPLTILPPTGPYAPAPIKVARAQLVVPPTGLLAPIPAGQLRVEGSGATPNATMTANGIAIGKADAAGNFRLQSASFTSVMCEITISDAVSSTQAPLAKQGC